MKCRRLWSFHDMPLIGLFQSVVVNWDTNVTQSYTPGHWSPFQYPMNSNRWFEYCLRNWCLEKENSKNEHRHEEMFWKNENVRASKIDSMNPGLSRKFFFFWGKAISNKIQKRRQFFYCFLKPTGPVIAMCQHWKKISVKMWMVPPEGT